jgi:hypothetical protein
MVDKINNKIDGHDIKFLIFIEKLSLIDVTNY